MQTFQERKVLMRATKPVKIRRRYRTTRHKYLITDPEQKKYFLCRIGRNSRMQSTLSSIWFVLDFLWLIFCNVSLSLCKGDRRRSSMIEPLPSSFSHLYSGRPEHIGIRIPKHQEVYIKFFRISVYLSSPKDALLELCGSEVALYLSNKPVTMQAERTSARTRRVSPAYERIWDVIRVIKK